MPEPLSSDILEDQFGPAGIDILLQEGDTRVIRTVAGNGQVLEISRVSFKGSAGGLFPEVHKQVLAGRSMGKAFRDDGVPFERRTRAVYGYELPAGFRGRFGAAGRATVVEVSILAGPKAEPYADILEVYSPAVRWPEAARAIDDTVAAKLRGLDELLTSLND